MLFGTALAKLFNLLIANNKSFALHTTVCVLATSFFTASLWKQSHTVVAEALHIKDKQIMSLNRKLFPFQNKYRQVKHDVSVDLLWLLYTLTTRSHDQVYKWIKQLEPVSIQVFLSYTHFQILQDLAEVIVAKIGQIDEL